MKMLCPYKCEGIELQELVDALKGGAELDLKQTLRKWMARGLLFSGIAILLASGTLFAIGRRTESIFLGLLPAFALVALILLVASRIFCRRKNEIVLDDTVLVPRDQNSSPLETMNRSAGVTQGTVSQGDKKRPKNGSKKSAAVKKAEESMPGIRLIRTVGHGTQGVVWRGEIESTNEAVAIKLFNLHDKESARALLREVSLCSRVNHPNVLNIILSDWANNYFVLVMEWVEGENLRPDLLPTAADKLECVRKLACGLRALNDADIVHRDIKPGNVMVRSAGGDPVIVDFGVAFDVRTRNLGQIEASGTPFYMPPESFAEDTQPSAADDAYALGMLTLHLFDELDLAGANSIPSLIQEKQNGSFATRLDGLIENLPSVHLQEFVTGLVAEDTEQRVATMAEADSYIDRALAGV